MKFGFTYLVKQDDKTWNEFSLSLYLLQKNILNKLNSNYKIIVFCEGPPNKKAKIILKDLKKRKIKIQEKHISLKEYVGRKESKQYLEEFPHASNCCLFTSLGYRDMCKFFAKDIFLDNIFDDVDYFIRVDTDSFFIEVRKK